MFKNFKCEDKACISIKQPPNTIGICRSVLIWLAISPNAIVYIDEIIIKGSRGILLAGGPEATLLVHPPEDFFYSRVQ